MNPNSGNYSAPAQPAKPLRGDDEDFSEEVAAYEEELNAKELKENSKQRYDGANDVWVICICIDCQSPNNRDAFIYEGHFGVCRFCGGKTKEIPVREFNRYKALSKYTGFRGGPAWSQP